MGCIQASAYTTGTILGTYSGVDALDQCNNFCGVCCIPQCVTDFSPYSTTEIYDPTTGDLIGYDVSNALFPWPCDPITGPATMGYVGYCGNIDTGPPAVQIFATNGDGNTYSQGLAYNYRYSTTIVDVEGEVGGCGWSLPEDGFFDAYTITRVYIGRNYAFTSTPMVSVFTPVSFNTGYPSSTNAWYHLVLVVRAGINYAAERIRIVNKYFECIDGNIVDKTQEAFGGRPLSSNIFDNQYISNVIGNDITEYRYTYIGDGYPYNYLVDQAPLDCLDWTSFNVAQISFICNDTIAQSGCVQGGVWHSGTSCANFDCNPCTTNTDCVYCETWFLAPRDYGYFTVTNAGNIIFNDTNDPNNDNGLNDTYDINGTYAFGFDTGTSQWYFHTTHINGIGFAIEKTGDHVGSAKLYILMGYYGGTMSGYTDLIWDSVGNNCLQISSPNCYPYEYSPFTLVNPLPCWPGQSCPSLIVNTPAPTVIWNLTGTDKTTCDNAGGFYNDINYSNPTTSVCLLYDRIAANGPCNPPAHIGGNYYTDSDPDPTLHPYSQTTNGACCGICYPPISIDINTGCPTPICPPNQ